MLRGPEMSGLRVVLCSSLLLMPTALNTRALAQSASAQQEITRLAATPAVHEAFEQLQKQEPELRRFQTELVKVAAPPFGEGKRAEWLAKKLRELGLKEVEIDKAGNVTAVRPGTDGKAKLVAVSAHIDTVFPADTAVNPRTEGNRIYGPGVSDNGAGVTAIYAIASALEVAGIRNRAGILFVGNVGEEGEGDLRGMRFLFAESKYKNHIGPTLVLDGAGTDSIVTQALGSRRYEVTVRGPGGHSWTDFGTPNPIVALANAIADFSATDVPSDPKTSFNIGVIQGGTSVNSIPESASMRVDIRSASDDQMEKLEAALRQAVAKAVREAQDTRAGKKPTLTSEMKLIGSRPAAELKRESRILEIVRAADAHLGLKTQIRRASTDANVPLSLGKEAVSIGAGGTGGGAHTVKEWYDPSGRDVGLKRILLTVLALAGT